MSLFARSNWSICTHCEDLTLISVQGLGSDFLTPEQETIHQCGVWEGGGDRDGLMVG